MGYNVNIKKYTVGDITLQITIKHGSVLALEIISSQGEHGKLALTMEVEESMETAQAQGLVGTDIYVGLKDGSRMFAGVCSQAALSNQAGYKTLQVTAYTSSIKMDKEAKKKTFQNPSKTFKQVADAIAEGYGAAVTLDQDCQISQVLYQQNETDWGFLKRIAAAEGKTVYVDTASLSPNIYIGKLGFRSFGAEVLGESLGSSRDTGEMALAEANGQAAEGYMFDTYECYCSALDASAGDRIDDVTVIKSGRIRLEKGVLENRITYAYEEGIKPTQEESTQPSLNRSVLTGKVRTISGNQIQVELDTDGGAGDMVWVPYESYISNSFYCMPDEGDTVFLYYENNGNMVCLGSRHASTESPDFEKPREDVLTNHDKMIKLGEKKACLTATREHHDGENPNEVSIIMDDDTGITLQSGREIKIKAKENLNLFTGNIEGYNDKYEEGQKKLQGRHEENEEIYKAESGKPGKGDLAIAALADFAKTQGENVLNIGKGMIMYDMWAGIYNSFQKDDSGDGDSQEEQPLETGVATLYGYESLVLQVSNNKISIDTDIHITADTFKWLGYTQGEHKAEELPLQDWWETALDGLQFALDIAGCFPVLGAVPDLINAGVSLMRGNFAEAAMSAVAAIPGAGDAVGAAKIAGKSLKIVTKSLTKAERIFSILQGLYVAAQGAFAIYQMRDGLADMWERWKNGENIFANPGDVSMIFNLLGSSTMVLRGAKGIGEGIVGKKIGLTYDGDPNYANGNTNRKEMECGDPINVVTGSFGMDYTDLQLRDVRETFFIQRIYESIYENKGMLLGNRWFLNIESRLQKIKDSVQVQLPDMKLVEFTRTEYGWENSRTHDRIWQLYSLEEGYLLKNHQQKKSYTYDKEGRLLSIADRFENHIRFHYENGHLSRLTLESGQSLTFAYEDNHLISITTGDGRSLKYEYEGEYLSKVILANDSFITYEYDSDGRIHSITDQNENTYVTNEYDRKGRVVRQTTSTGCEFALFYDEKARKTTFTDISTGEQTIYEYDSKKTVTKTTYQDGTTEEYGYDDWENCIYEKDRNGNETRRLYDIYGNLLEEQLPSGLATINEYDVHNQRVHQKDNAGREVTWTYDERGCLVAEALLTAPGKWSRMSFAYDSFGRIIEERNPNGNLIEYAYQKFSEPVRRTYPEGETTWFEYDQAGRCLREWDHSGTEEYSYNRTDCLTRIKDRDGNILRFQYDFLGNRTAIIKPEQHALENGKIEITYDELDHINSVTTAQGNVYRYWNGGDGRLLKAVHPNAFNQETQDGEGMVFDYDETGRRIRVHYPDGGCERYFLDGNGNIIKKVAPEQYEAGTDDGAGYTYEYDSADRLTKVTDPYGNVQQAYIYDMAGNIIKSIDARGYLTADTDEERAGTMYTYNLAGWILSRREPLRKEADGSVRYRLTCYRYDDMGNLLEEKRFLDEQSEESRSGRTHVLQYAYDRSNRLVQVSDSTGAAVRYGYDETGYLTGEKVRVGEDTWKETRYEYSPAGKLLRSMVRLKGGEPEAAQETDVQGAPGREKEARNTVSWKPQEIRESDWAVTAFSYDKNGNVTKVKMPEGGCYYYEYDRDDRLIRERHAEEGGEIQNEIRYAYDAAGNCISVTDVNGNKYEHEYDLCDREVAVTAPDGGRTRMVHDRNGNVVCRYTPMQLAGRDTQENAAGAPIAGLQTGWRYSYDLNDRMTEVSAPEGTVLNSFRYELDGQLKGIADATGSGINLEYDLAGRRIYACTSGESSQSYRYDAMGNLIGLTDGLEHHTEFILDPWGRITGIKKPDGSMEQYAYDYMGNMLRTEDGEGNAVTFRYDLNGNMTARIDQTGDRELFGYDRENRLVSMTDRNGTYTRITYNMYGSITSRTAVAADKSGTVAESYGYYPDGKLRCAMGGGMRYDYLYDAMGRLSKKSASGRTLLWNEYDLNGNRTAMTDLTGKRLEYRYDSLDRLEEIRDNAIRQVSYRYNADGTIRRMEVGTGLVTEYTYDADKNVISQKTVMAGMDKLPGYENDGITGLLSQQNKEAMEKSPAENQPFIRQMNERDRSRPFTLVDNTYAYDANGNRTGKQTLAGLTAYQYDAVNQLVKVDYPTGSEEYRYDKAGNRTEKLVNGMTAERYQYDARNRLISRDIMSQRADGTNAAVHKEYTYDRQGNMLSDGTRSFAYDAMNRLSQITNEEGGIQKNRYDGEGLRAEMEENGRLATFLFDEDKVVAETESDGNVIRYIRGYELVSSDSEKARTYYHYASDELGSITHVTDGNGNVCNYYEYDAFGEFTVREETVANRFAYAGEQYDPVAGLYYLRARFYNPVIGRFIQEDTYYGDGLNLYSYCQNNPVRYVDPSGHNGMCPEKAAAIKKLMDEEGLTEEQAKKRYESLRNKSGSDSVKRMNVGDSGHHVPAVRKSKDRSFEVSRSDKTRPTIFPKGSDPGHDHWRLHDAEKNYIGPRQGDFVGTNDELFDAYRNSYKGLDDIKVDVKSPNGTYVLGTDVTPYEAVDLIQNWLKEQGLY